ncbi:MAG: 5'-3' exonuclease H3TH domain-containing protein, partial [Hyphomicrobiaceae bacterium]
MSTDPEKKRPAAVNSVPDGEPVPIAKGSHVYLIDGSGYIFRAFHALPPLTRPSDGLPVGAVHGFCQMLWKLMQETRSGRGPTHIAVIFDAARENYRNAIYPDYKANRPPAPEELVPQFPLIRDAVKAFNVACIEQEGFEADDLIATYTREAIAKGGEVTIVSSDKDLMQLVKPGVVMLDTMKNKSISREEVIDKFGVEPDKVVDVQSLAGDSVDNVPGVPGIGVKTAADLIREYGDLDALLARAGEIKQPKRRERLIEFAEQARISRELVRLKDDVPVEISADRFGLHDVTPDPLLTFMREMEFNTLTKRVAEALDVPAPPPLPQSVGDSVTSSTSRSRKGAAKPADGGTTAHAAHGEATPADVVAFARSAASEPKVDPESY